MTRALVGFAMLALTAGCAKMDSLRPLPAAWGEATSGDIIFACAVDRPTEIVYLTGDFTAWHPTRIRMMDPEGDGTFTATQALYPGVYDYQYVAIVNPWHSPGDAWARHDTAFVSPVQTLHVNGVRGW